MAKYEVKMSCGHIQTVELSGKIADRKEKIQYLEECGVCLCCKNAKEAINCKEVEMHYSEYKNNYSDCKTKIDSYNSETKTIVVFVPVEFDNNDLKAERKAIKELCKIQNITKDHPSYEKYVEMYKKALANPNETIKQFETRLPSANEAKKAKAQMAIEIIREYKNAIKS